MWLKSIRQWQDRIGIQVLYSGVLIGLTLHGWHAFNTAGVRLKQKFSFSNFCPGCGWKPGPHSLMAVNVTTRLRRHPQDAMLCSMEIKVLYLHKFVFIDTFLLKRIIIFQFPFYNSFAKFLLTLGFVQKHFG